MPQGRRGLMFLGFFGHFQKTVNRAQYATKKEKNMKKTVLNSLAKNVALPSLKHDKVTPPESKIVNSNGVICSLAATDAAININRRRDTSFDEVIRPRDLPHFLGISRTTCWRLDKDPSSGFPKKIHLSKGAVGYLRRELSEYIESRQHVSEG